LVPLPQILAELIMALGAALLFANVYALVRPRLRGGREPAPQVQARGRVVINMLIGLVVMVWGFASFVAGGSA